MRDSATERESFATTFATTDTKQPTRNYPMMTQPGSPSDPIAEYQSKYGERWWMADNPVVKVLRACYEPYLVFRVRLIGRRMWRREMRGWAAVFASELRFAARATIALVHHHLKARPRYSSAEFQQFRRNDWPAGSLPSWRRGWPTIADEKHQASLTALPVTALPWPRGMVLH
jgi:hypothetical protein